MKQSFWSNTWNRCLVALIVVKALLLISFTSDFQHLLFIPFATHFLEHGGNPWQYFYAHPSGAEFPYSALMMYFFALAYAPIHFLGITSPLLKNIFFNLPIIAADGLILILLLRSQLSKRDILIYYFASPIVIYASYMHGQLDIVPTALLFLAIFLLLRNRILWSALVFGCALATKLHVIIALPLMMIYVFRKDSLLKALLYMLIAAAVFYGWIAPYLSEGYVQLVLNNNQQALIYDAYILIGNGKIYLPFIVLTILFGRFVMFRRINQDLLYTFLALVFAAIVSFLVPAPGWYVWLFPFISIFFIKSSRNNPQMLQLYIILNAIYLLCVICFYQTNYVDLYFFGHPVDLKIMSDKARNLSATLLTSVLFACMYAFYKFGIKSNEAYRHDQSLIIGIAGDSGAGKSTLLDDVKTLLNDKLLCLEGDADHKWERGDDHWQEYTHLNPKANFLHRQFDDLMMLKRGKKVWRSDYDHSTGTFTKQQKIPSRDYVALSGLHAFYLPRMRKAIDLKIFVDTQDKLRGYWKIVRDVAQRGHAKEEVLKKIAERQQDADKYINPQRDFADMIVRYFVDEGVTLDDQHIQDKIKVQITLNSSVHCEKAIDLLGVYFDIQWDYAPDLQTQFVILHGSALADDIQKIASKIIFNIDDLIGKEPVWQSGYRGVVQLFFLMALSDQLRGEGVRSYV